MRLRDPASTILAGTRGSAESPPAVHRHHRPGEALSRRAFLRAAGAAGGSTLGASLLGPAAAAARSLRPVPVPGGTEIGGRLFHLFLPGPGNEPSTITDFVGDVGIAVVDGTWEVARGNPRNGVRRGSYEGDLRFMKGVFRAANGAFHQATFGFV
jgi:hypothetical protein